MLRKAFTELKATYKKGAHAMVKTDEAILNNIVTDYYIFGKSQATIAGEQGVGATTVLNVIRSFEAVKTDNWDECIRLYSVGVSASNIQWAAKWLSKELPENVAYALTDSRKKDVPPPATSSEKNENVYLIRVLEELAKQNELLQQLIDVVIPKYTEDLRNATMKNAVILCNKFQHTIDDVSAMKDVISQIHEELK